MSGLALLFQSGSGYTDFLKYSGENLILPTLQSLKDDTAALSTAANTYAGSPDASTNLTALRAAWIQARVSLKKVETFYFGPASLPSSASYYTKLDGFEKGSSTRPLWTNVNQVILNPGSNPCATGTIDVSALSICAFKYKGFEALEMLIFDNDGDPATSTSLSAINTANTGNARRMAYLQALAGLIAQDAATLYTTWSPTGGNFVKSFIAGTGTYFRSPAESFDTYIQSVGNLSVQMEELKLGTPACLSNSCTTAASPTSNAFSTEAIYSKNGYSDLYYNLLGIEWAYLGNPADTEIHSISTLIQAQNPSLDTDIQNAITALKNSLNSKVTGSADLFGDINSDGGAVNGTNVTTYVKPVWLLAATLKGLLTVDAFSALGVPNLPSANDGD
ncbi:imelysin [Leptospira langatensis]|uniref:Imelysin n=2 Tax=Leptospira langatensis TaxID=2484983 RepID=A0A5F1ZR41_9LEPT|nr:imelysin [Leptospira langatensis]TGL40270.1 imelysin [Leptospira langatensis]